MLEKEYKYYLDHKKELLSKYSDKYIVIVGEEVVGAYDTENEAFLKSNEKFGVGSFYIQYCDAKGGSSIQTFHSRVSFA